MSIQEEIVQLNGLYGSVVYTYGCKERQFHVIFWSYFKNAYRPPPPASSYKSLL